MEEREFITAADQTLKRLLAHLDDLEIESELTDGKLVMTFEDGTTLIVNRQGAAHQLWLAEPGGGWHFNFENGKWIDSKRNVELLESLESLIGRYLGHPVRLKK